MSKNTTSCTLNGQSVDKMDKMDLRRFYFRVMICSRFPNPKMPIVYKMTIYTLKILQQMLQDF